MVNKSYVEAERAVTATGDGDLIRTKARAQAENVLGAFFVAMDWRVTVRWGGRPQG